MHEAIGSEVAVIVTHTILVGAQINWMTISGTADPSAGFRALECLNRCGYGAKVPWISSSVSSLPQRWA